MKYKLIIALLFFVSKFTFAQEFIADVKVDYSQVQNSNTSTYQALEKSLKDFINTTKWSDKTYKIHEKIEAAFNIIITEKTGSNKYRATLLVQSRRPVYNSTYYTPILNINDTNFEFEYTDFQQLIFNERKFSGTNLTDVIGYYIYLILGYDADSFAKEGGTKYFKTVEQIAANAQSSNFSGWSTQQGSRNRSSLIKEILSPSGRILRNVSYEYNFKGLDQMYQNEIEAKNTIGEALLKLDYYARNNDYTQNYPLDIFFAAKKNEISQIFSGGLNSTFGLNKLKELLGKISPNNDNLWKKMNK
ncbi:DUF4835 family protein [Weeksellaceae bacterium TAE3-ERU29]|nr:DUF4835 family protein [Weeksellaceae bacterium TAE3-ERU29]